MSEFFRLIFHLCISILVITLVSCENRSITPDRSQWGIDPGQIRGSLTPWPLIKDPDYHKAGTITDMNDSDRVLAFESDGQVYVYPIHDIYNVEIVNDIISGIPLAITYCPLTKSGLVWKRIIAEDTLDFTPSGYLFNSNLMPYDFETETIWSQMRMIGVKGSQRNHKLQILHLLETSWYNIKTHFPDAKVYRRNLPNPDGRLSKVVHPGPSERIDKTTSGEAVFGIPGKNYVDLYQFSSFGNSIKAYSNSSEENILVVGSEENQFITAFRTDHLMNPVQDEFPVILIDNTGSKWNIFGVAVSGPRKGEKLEAATGYFATLWAWESIFEDFTINLN